MKCDNIHCFNESSKLFGIVMLKPSKPVSVNLCNDCYNTIYATLERLIGERKKGEYNRYLATVAQSGRV